MDRTWMSKYRFSLEYVKGLREFFRFANKNLGEFTPKRCPCKSCANLYEHPVDTIKHHLFRWGFDPSYRRWTWHGESSLDEDLSNVHTHEGIDHDFDMNIPDDAFVTEKMVQAATKEYIGDPEKFRKLLEDAEKPLYEGSNFTRLSAVVQLFNEKAKSGSSDISFSRHLKLLGKMLPKGNLLPSSMNEVKKILSVYGMKYEKIHACPNDCILYRKQYEKDVICPTCKVSRYKENKTKKENSGVPAKVLWYFPIIPRFKRMFQSTQTAKDLTWHATGREVDDCLRHPADSPAWKFVDSRWPQFGAESRNIRLALSSDGFNPHGSLSSMYSCWPVLLITYNLPPWLCMKRKFMMLTLLISGPRQPGNDIDVYLAPLIDDLILLWEKGVEAFDVYRQESFILRAILLWTINDFPAYSNLSGCIVKGYYACPICSEDIVSYRLKHTKKNVYTGTRRFLSRSHPYRRQKKVFNGEQELRPKPKELTGEEVLEKVKNIVTLWGKKVQEPPTPKRPREKKKKNVEKTVAPKQPRAKNTNVKDDKICWKKKSIFFELDYWIYLLLRHNLDVMHIEKNVCESLIGTLFNIPGKTKDGLNVRLDLQEMGLRTELAPVISDTRTFLPPACYTLSRDEKIRVCRTLHELKVPKGYSSNFKPLVSMQDLKLHGLKSHDCHVLMQQLLPVALRSVLPKHVRYAIMRLCFFFNAICAKVIEIPKLLEIQADIVVTLCMLEKYFPPSFFDIMVHLMVHLVREVQLGGLVFFRWMYVFERYMSVLKGYVRNRSTTNNETFSKTNSIPGQPKHHVTTKTTLPKPSSLSVQSKDIGTKSNRAMSKPKVTSGQPKHHGTTNTTMSKPKATSVEAQECSLALDNRSNIVAKATVFKRKGADEKLHTVSLGDAYVRVAIHTIILDKHRQTPLPIPVDEDTTTFASSIGTIVAWPKELVIVGDETMIADENEAVDLGADGDKPDNEVYLETFTQMIDDMMFDPEYKEEMLAMDRSVFELEVTFYIALDEVRDVCQMDRLNCPVIIAYMRYLYENYESSRERFGFCYPGNPNQFEDLKRSKSNQTHQTIAQRLRNCQKNQVIFLPYSIRRHWVLIVIDPSSKEVYYLDSTNAGPNDATVSLVNLGITSHNMAEKGKKGNPTWIKVQCPEQPGNVECGYYVMRFMRHFVIDPHQSLQTKILELETKTTYTRDEIDEVRIEFLNYVH